MDADYSAENKKKINKTRRKGICIGELGTDMTLIEERGKERRMTEHRLSANRPGVNIKARQYFKPDMEPSCGTTLRMMPSVTPVRRIKNGIKGLFDARFSVTFTTFVYESRPVFSVFCNPFFFILGFVKSKKKTKIECDVDSPRRETRNY